MKFLVNEKKQAQCPECGKFNLLKHNDQTLMHEFSCCRRKFSVFIDKEKLEEIGK